MFSFWGLKRIILLNICQRVERAILAILAVLNGGYYNPYQGLLVKGGNIPTYTL